MFNLLRIENLLKKLPRMRDREEKSFEKLWSPIYAFATRPEIQKDGCLNTRHKGTHCNTEYQG